MKRIPITAFFTISYFGVFFALYCVMSGLLPVVRLLFFLFSASGLALLGTKDGRNGFYMIPGMILTLFAVFVAGNGFFSLFSLHTLLIGALRVIYGVVGVILGLLTVYHL